MAEVAVAAGAVVRLLPRLQPVSLRPLPVAPANRAAQAERRASREQGRRTVSTGSPVVMEVQVATGRPSSALLTTDLDPRDT